MREIVKKLYLNQDLSDEEFLTLLKSDEDIEILNLYARKRAEENYGKSVFLRGLIEISNICAQDCFYCGIRHSNKKIKRYDLNEEDIIKSCRTGYDIGFRTFVLQGGEDEYFTDEKLSYIIKSIKKFCTGAAVTLSLGIRNFESYKKLKSFGADRYLLRHETADEEIFSKLHPKNQSFAKRKQALYELKSLGFQAGAGMMIGAPFVSFNTYLKDIRFMQSLNPAMIGIGPFIPAKGTPFENMPCGSAYETLKMISILRLIFPQALIPSTTALNTLEKDGWSKGILAGANVIMPNLSPDYARKNYTLYDHKKIHGLEAAENVKAISTAMEKIGYKVDMARGDVRWRKNVR